MAQHIKTKTWYGKTKFNSIQFNPNPWFHLQKMSNILLLTEDWNQGSLCLKEHMTKMYLFIYFIITPLILTKNNPSNCYLSKNLQLTHYEWCKNYVGMLSD